MRSIEDEAHARSEPFVTFATFCSNSLRFSLFPFVKDRFEPSVLCGDPSGKLPGQKRKLGSGSGEHAS
jgi:hypothetical protein